jgi:hypothetical protein
MISLRAEQLRCRTCPRRTALLGNSALTRYKDKFLIEEIWTDDRSSSSATSRSSSAQPNPYWHGKKPIVITQTRPDLFEMVGISETELVDDIQQALQTFQNMRDRQRAPHRAARITYREGGVTDPNMLELRPRFKWPVQTTTTSAVRGRSRSRRRRTEENACALATCSW